MKALVTGGTGFLGAALVRTLCDSGWEVIYTARRQVPATQVPSAATFMPCDLASSGATDILVQAMAGADVVFHTAAKTGVWGRRRDFMATNLAGTEAVLAACAAYNTNGAGDTGRAVSATPPVLVHTSSPSVCFDGLDHRRAGPDLPRGTRFSCAYPESKARAEEAVEQAWQSGPLLGCILRPHLIYGPGDPHLLPRIVDRARSGRLRRIGAGDNEVSLCFIEHAVAAHISAARKLLADGRAATCAKRSYFIADSEPVLLWPWIDELLLEAGLTPVERSLSRRRATLIGTLCEVLWRALPLRGEPPMTRFVAGELATSHSYDMDPARRELGYEPRVSPERARQLALADLRARGLLP
ncbi:MAG: NAD-dependent epimerase/dehydratase family protein [Planctomycetota bacterium]|nr:NAD-dependent epimerase/dehydratase family protein [Planctomycetota bacterium]